MDCSLHMISLIFHDARTCLCSIHREFKGREWSCLTSLPSGCHWQPTCSRQRALLALGLLCWAAGVQGRVRDTDARLARGEAQPQQQQQTTEHAGLSLLKVMPGHVLSVGYAGVQLA